MNDWLDILKDALELVIIVGTSVLFFGLIIGGLYLALVFL